MSDTDNNNNNRERPLRNRLIGHSHWADPSFKCWNKNNRDCCSLIENSPVCPYWMHARTSNVKFNRELHSLSLRYWYIIFTSSSWAKINMIVNITSIVQVQYYHPYYIISLTYIKCLTDLVNWLFFHSSTCCMLSSQVLITWSQLIFRFSFKWTQTTPMRYAGG